MSSSKVGVERTCRIDQANRVIEAIAEHGRKFFSLHADGRQDEPNRISKFELVNGRLFFLDKWTQKRTYVFYRRGQWIHFSEGGTLRALVEGMADWIVGKRKDFPRAFGPWPEWICEGDLWGYGSDMSIVQQKVTEIVTARETNH